jgi:hypothetical protein
MSAEAAPPVRRAVAALSHLTSAHRPIVRHRPPECERLLVKELMRLARSAGAFPEPSITVAPSSPAPATSRSQSTAATSLETSIKLGYDCGSIAAFRLAVKPTYLSFATIMLVSNAIERRHAAGAVPD